MRQRGNDVAALRGYVGRISGHAAATRLMNGSLVRVDIKTKHVNSLTQNATGDGGAHDA
jgi:hypothetical protein